MAIVETILLIKQSFCCTFPVIPKVQNYREYGDKKAILGNYKE